VKHFIETGKWVTQKDLISPKKSGSKGAESVSVPTGVESVTDKGSPVYDVEGNDDVVDHGSVHEKSDDIMTLFESPANTTSHVPLEEGEDSDNPSEQSSEEEPRLSKHKSRSKKKKTKKSKRSHGKYERELERKLKELKKRKKKYSSSSSSESSF
jgi:hypothetical protein